MSTTPRQRPRRWNAACLAMALGAVLAGAPNASAQEATGTVTGRVTDAKSGAPIDGASVEVSSARIGSLSSAEGRFRITGVQAGPRLLIVRRIGFAVIRREVNVIAGQETTADFFGARWALSSTLFFILRACFSILDTVCVSD